MTRDLIELAIKEGTPFEIRMADGEKHHVRDHHQIALGRTYAMVIGDRDLPHVLPLLTMTGLTYLDPTAGAPASS